MKQPLSVRRRKEVKRATKRVVRAGLVRVQRRAAVTETQKILRQMKEERRSLLPSMRELGPLTTKERRAAVEAREELLRRVFSRRGVRGPKRATAIREKPGRDLRAAAQLARELELGRVVI